MKQKRARAHQKEEVEGTAKLPLDVEVQPFGRTPTTVINHRTMKRLTNSTKRKRIKSNVADKSTVIYVWLNDSNQRSVGTNHHGIRWNSRGGG
jgi:hypothetical protein